VLARPNIKIYRAEVVIVAVREWCFIHSGGIDELHATQSFQFTLARKMIARASLKWEWDAGFMRVLRVA